MVSKRSKDPITAAITSYLWPYLKEVEFTKSTARNFSKEKNGFFQQIWIDASGFSGRESVRLHFSVMPIAVNNIKGYSVGDSYDSFDMSSHDRADSAMQEVIKLINNKFLLYLDNLSNYEAFIKEFSNYGLGEESYKQDMLKKLEKWKCNNFSKLEISKIKENRIQLKLQQA